MRQLTDIRIVWTPRYVSKLPMRQLTYGPDNKRYVRIF